MNNVKDVHVQTHIEGDFMLPDHIGEAIEAQGKAIGTMIGNTAELNDETKGEFLIQFRVVINPQAVSKDSVNEFEEIFELKLPAELGEKLRREIKQNPITRETFDDFLKFFREMKAIDAELIKRTGSSMAADFEHFGVNALFSRQPAV